MGVVRNEIPTQGMVNPTNILQPTRPDLGKGPRSNSSTLAATPTIPTGTRTTWDQERHPPIRPNIQTRHRGTLDIRL